MVNRPVAGTVLWDFDGTLGHRRHGTWADCLLEVLDRHHPDHAWKFSDLYDALATGFPWHHADKPHPQLADPDQWWAHTTTVIHRALTGLGIDHDTAAAAAHATRGAYTDASTWSLYPHALQVLDTLGAAGWQHVLVSNHVPELPTILAATELAPRLAAVVNSAATGYEKPHPQAFRLAHQAAAATGRVWMVGDNPNADVAGARVAGVDAIWVRCPNPADTPDLRAVLRLILDQAAPARETATRVWEIPPVTADATRRTVRIG
ncbi:HAD-IA family hydrolase [Kitasatospora sp. NPDC050463]|uniref:HAD family hydrolase n=1 Tax=Kitasatospora sp. NPDC050463 TaxID=3155786 RepID=UPI0033F116CC